MKQETNETFSIRKFNTGTHSARLAKKSLAIAGAVLLATSGTLVQADEVSTETTQPNTVSEENAKEVTQADVETAKVTAEKATQETQAQASVVAEAKQAVTSATEDVASAETKLSEAQALADQATPEGIEKAQTAISTAEKEVTEAEQALSEAKEAETAQSEVVATKEAQAQASQQKVAEKTAEVTQVQAELNQAQAILDGTGQAQIIKEAEDAAETLAKDEKALTQAEEALAQAKQADADRQAAIEKAQAQVTATTEALETATKLAQEAQETANQTAQALKTAQEAYVVAENDVKAINTITITAEYVSALRDYALNYREKGAEAKALLDAMASDLRAKNVFKANANDDTTILDTNNLSEATRTELSLFASDLINQIRQAFGTTLTSVTKGALELADLTTDGYVSDNWSLVEMRTIGHDAKAVNAAAKALGLETSSPEEEAQGLQGYENMNTWGNTAANVTLTSAKRKIYQSILAFMFNGYEYLHAESIAGLQKDTQYLGVDLSSRTGANSAHFLMVADKDLTTGATFDKTAITNNKTAEMLEANYKAAEKTLTEATLADNQAQEQLSLKQSDKALAEANVTVAQDDLAKAQAIPVQTPFAEQAVSLAEEKVLASSGANQKAQEALKSLQADVKQKQANVATAKALLETKEAELTALKQTQVADEQALNLAKTAKAQATLKVSEAEQALSEAKAKQAAEESYLKSLQEAPANLQEAKEALKSLQADVKQKQANVATAIAYLEELKATEQKATSHYQAVLKAYQEVLEAKRQAQLAKEKEALIKAGHTPVPVTDKTGKVTGYVAGVKQTEVLPQSQSLKKQDSQTKKTLPNTGTASTSLGLLGLVLTMAGTLGILVTPKHHHR